MSGRDPGLQRERTALAWRRAALAALVNALLLARMGWSGQQGALLVLAATMLLLTVALAVAAAARQRALSRGVDAVYMPAALPALTAAAASLAAGGAAVGMLLAAGALGVRGS